MAKPKTTVNNASVTAFINSLNDPVQRADTKIVLALYKKITKEKPKMWGTSIIGFGMYHYKSERSAQEGDWPVAAFSPRKQNLTLYLMLDSKENTVLLLQKLGKHKTSKACLYIKRLADVDLAILEKLIKVSYLAAKKL